MSENCTHDCSTCSANCPSRSAGDMMEKLNMYSSVTRVIAVASGKGGVGKSSVTAILANLMAQKGYKVAIMDADITGPSIPRIYGIEQMAEANELGIIPIQTKNGISVMSINLLLEDPTMPVIWRGPVLASVIKQFWSDILWGDIDYMFVDMPPGTGDVPMTVFQSLPIDGVISVTTPQDLVGLVVSKAVNMASEMNIPRLGFIENMSYVLCPDCGKKLEIFGESKVDDIAMKFEAPVLGKLPLSADVAKFCDEGRADLLDPSGLEKVIAVLEGLDEI